MSGLLKKLSFRTGQSRQIVYYRPIIFGKDKYGVENNSVIVNEINVPNVPAYIRNIVDKDYVVERGGHSITGKSRIFLPNLTTLKNYPNLDQDTNTYFNDITDFRFNGYYLRWSRIRRNNFDCNNGVNRFWYFQLY